MEAWQISIKTIGTPGKGLLSFFETNKDIPFDIKRVYYTYGVPVYAVRGGHAHRNLSQLLFCPHGEIEVLLDDGRVRESVLLDDPSKALIVKDMTWHEMVWRKEDSILVVAASDHYNEDDYVRDYGVFLSEIGACDGDTF